MRGYLLLLLLLLVQSTGPRNTPPSAMAERLTADQFTRLSRELSEAGGYFDTDNLISNESSYLHVLGKMREMEVSGGAFIGVGPDQSFSYIAQIRPRIAFMVDIRRDNLLQHLFYKGLFHLSRNRIEFLCHLFGRPIPANSVEWEARTAAELANYLGKGAGVPKQREETWNRLREYFTRTGLGLTTEELATIERIHLEFFAGGVGLKFTSHQRAPQPYYPTYRDLMLEKDLTGRPGSFLAREESFQFLKDLQARNLVVPVVGNLAGEKALRGIGRYLDERGLQVTALYTSNVEYYLMRGGQFRKFAENVSALPIGPRSVLIRSYFGNSWGGRHPQAVPGYYSTQLLQTLESFVSDFRAGRYRSYGDIVGKG